MATIFNESEIAAEPAERGAACQHLLTDARVPTLAAVVPSYVETVTIFGHADPAGQHGALKLAEQLCKRGIEVRYES
jgi:hypothetical protein